MHILEIIKHHQQTKQHFSIQDAYKLLYQCNFGVSHILENKEHAKQFLVKEFNSITPSQKEPLIESISTDDQVVRINLRTFKSHNNDINALFRVMLDSALEINGSMSDFINLWQEFKIAVEDGFLTFNKNEMRTFDNLVITQNYPVMHHSDKYRQANQPAYRVVKTGIYYRYFPIVRTS